MALLAYNGSLDRIHTLEEEKAQFEKYFSEIEAWKNCIEETKLYEVDGEKVIRLVDVQSCEQK